MMTNPKPLRIYIACLAVCLLTLAGASCAPTVASSAPLPIARTVEVTRIVTSVATSEVTRLVDVPVTITPSATSTPAETYTPSPSPTATRPPTKTSAPELPLVSILVHSQCLYGPGSAYLFKYGLNATIWMRVFGRNEDGTWLFVKASDDPVWNGCWIKADLVKFLSGSVGDVPVFWNSLPYSVLYLPPVAVSASRVGNKVTIFWTPVWMTEDDYRGYLIEAWVCQGGKQVFVPLGYVTDVFKNDVAIRDKVLLVTNVMDEPGCDQPSRARIYSVEKHGYTNYRMIKWPGFDSAASGTPTPTP